MKSTLKGTTMTAESASTSRPILGDMNSQFAAFRKSIRICAVVCAVLIVSTTSALADDGAIRYPIMRPPADYGRYDESWTPKQAAEWAAAQESLKQIKNSDQSPDQKCHANWNILWPLAKAGNLEARLEISRKLGLMRGIDGTPFFSIEGRPSDYFALVRDYAIGFFYSWNSPTQRRIPKEDRLANAEKFIPVIGADESSRRCFIENDEAMVCLTRSKEASFLPSYETYAAEIESYLKSDSSLSCKTRSHDSYR